MTQLIGAQLLEKVEEMRADAANSNSDIAIACGYIRENGKPDFVEFYTQMIDAKGLNDVVECDEEVSELRAELNEKYGEEAVDAFCQIWDEDDLEHFEDAYQGEMSGKEFAQSIVEDCYALDAPFFVEIDWEATWQNLSYDYYEEDGFIFSANW